MEPKAIEVLRVWLIDGKLSCTVNTSYWEDPAMFGTVLADTLNVITVEFAKLWNLEAKVAKSLILQKVKEAVIDSETA